MSVLLAHCCCNPETPPCAQNENFDRMVESLGGVPGQEYIFSAPFLMSVRVPMRPSTFICEKKYDCWTGPEETGRFCNVTCAGPACTTPFPNSACTLGSNYYHLGAFLWTGQWEDVKVYTSQVCRFLYQSYSECSSTPCQSVTYQNKYERDAIGNASWNDLQTPTQLGDTLLPANKPTWDMWYDPPYTPDDPCEWRFRPYTPGLNASRIRPPTPGGYKYSTIHTYPPSNSCGPPQQNQTCQMVVEQELGFLYKSNSITGCAFNECPPGCVEPCVAMFLRVNITGTVKKTISPILIDPAGGVTNGFCGSYVPPTHINVRTEAYYRSYWDGNDTLEQWFLKPLKLYRINGSGHNTLCGAPGETAKRCYTFADEYTNGECANPIGGSVCLGCAMINGICTQCQSAPSTLPLCSMEFCRKTVCNQTLPNQCDTQYADSDCDTCDGIPSIYPNCRVCSWASVEYDVCKTMPAGQYFSQADIDAMPCDWENVPLSITPSYAPQQPVVVQIQGIGLCGGFGAPIGTQSGGTKIFVTCKHSLYATDVLVGGISCTEVTWINNGMVTAITPANSAGSKCVQVVTPGGTSICTAVSNFFYVNAGPQLCSISPGSGNVGTLLTISGRNFVPNNTQVTIGGILCTSTFVQDSSSLTCIVPAPVPPSYIGTRPITVTTPYGSITSPSPFEYI